MNRRLLVPLALSLLLTLMFASAASAVDFLVYLDLDDDAASGCAVATADGPFPGVEEILVTTVETGQVIALARQTCVDPGTDTFSAPVAIGAPFAPPWPVGSGLGTFGSDVVETFYPLDAGCDVVRLGYASAIAGASGDALLTVDGSGGGSPIRLDCRGVLEIPTLSQWALMLLAALLSIAAWRLLRRHPSSTAALVLVAVLMSAFAGVVWAMVMLDGDPGDWVGLDATLADDATGDAPTSGDILATFASQDLDQGVIFFRFDVTTNSSPIAVDDVFATDEDTLLMGDVLAANPTTADSDPDGDPLSVVEVDGNGADVGVQITLSSGALLTLNANGTFAYDPNGAFESMGDADSAQDVFDYTITDGNGGIDTATVTIDVAGVNDCPAAVDDAVSTGESTVLNGDVLVANPTTPDSDPEGDTLIVTEVDGNAADVGVQVTLASGALLTVNANGTFTYDPNGAFDSLGDGESDTDSFTYTVDDGSGTCSATATVTVTINGNNSCPTAVDDAVSTDEDSLLNGNVLVANPTTTDSDPDGDPLTVIAVNGNLANVGVQITLASGALLTVNANGTFSYDPNGAFNSLGVGDSDSDSFTYTVDDGSGTCSETATVTVTISGVNDCPTAVDDAVSTDEDTVLNGDVTTANPTTADSDPEGDTLVVTAVNGNGANVGVQIALGAGLVTVNANGTFSFDPNGGFDSLGVGEMATEMFTYTLDDGSGTCSETATVTVTIIGVNDLPMVAGETFDDVANTLLQVAASQTSTPSVFVMGSLLSNDSDGDGPSPLTASLNTATVGAVVTVAADGTFTYLPPAGMTASDSFTYDVSDGSGSTTATVTITFFSRVWYVDNTAAAAGLGRSADPFDTLVEAETAHGANDMICVRTGDGTTTGHDAGIEISFSGVLLHGEHHGCEPNVGLNSNAAPTSLVPPSVGNHPLIDHSAGGVGVQVSADTGDLTGIFIRGLNLDGDDNAVDIEASGANQVDVGVQNNTLRGAGGDGIDVNHSSSAGDSRVRILNNVLAATGNGADIRTTAGGLDVVFNNNSDITGAKGVFFDGSGGGTLTVSGFSGNSVHQDTSGNGIEMDTVVFDADAGTNGGGDADFTGDTVAGGDTSVGTAGDGVGGAGILLAGVTGDLSFGDLDVEADGGVGLQAMAAAPLNAAAGTGFRLTTGAGTSLTATGGPALDLDPLTAALTISALTSTNSATQGVSLNDVSGSVTITGGSIVNAAAIAFLVDGAAPTVSYGGSMTLGDTTAVSVTNTTGGSVTVDNGILSTDGGNFAAIQATNTDGAVNVTNMGVSHSNGRVIVFDDVDGGASFSGTTISTTNHHGVSVQNSAGALTFPNIVIAVGTPAPVDAVFLNANGTATINFSRIAVNTNGAGVRGLVATSSGTVNVTDNTSLIAATGGPAVVINPTTVGMVFASVSSSNSNGVGASFVGVSGSFVASGGSINGAAGTAFEVGNGTANSGSNGTITYAGGITNAAGRAAVVQDRTGGTVTISGAVVDTGATNSGILVDDNNSGNPLVRFTGTVDITNTSGSALTVSDNTGGRVQFADLDIVNDTADQVGLSATNNGSGGRLDVDTGTVDSGSATAIDIDNTVLGNSGNTTAGLTLVRVTSDEASANEGINLAFTTGALTVIGDGAAGAGLAANNGSGGTISNKTGDSVVLNSVTNVSLNYMNITNGLGHGINGTAVNGFVLTRSNVTNHADTNGEAPLFFRGLTGTAAANPELEGGSNQTLIANSLIAEGDEDNIQIKNETGTLARLVVRDSTIGSTTFGDRNENDGINFEGLSSGGGNAVMNLRVENCNFIGNAGDHINPFHNGASGSMDIDIFGSDFRGSASHGSGVGGGITIAANDASVGSGNNVTYVVDNNDFRDVVLVAIDTNLVISSGTMAMSGTINNNRIGTSGVFGSGSSTGVGIRARSNRAGTHTVAITNNTIRNWVNGGGITIQQRDGNGTLNATVTGNTEVHDAGGFPFGSGLQVESGAVAADMGTVCIDIGGAGGLANTLTEPNAFDPAILVLQNFATTMRFPAYAGAATNPAAHTDLNTFLGGRNTLSANGVAADAVAPTFQGAIASGVSGGMPNTCPQP